MRLTGYARGLLRRLEGLRLEAYQDGGGVWTIGYGHTGDIRFGQRVTEHQAEVILDLDLQRFTAGVERLVATAPNALNDNQFSALVIFAFNVGLMALAGSTAMRDILSGHLNAVPAELARWNKVRDHSGVPIVNPILVARRKAEAELWDTPTEVA